MLQSSRDRSLDERAVLVCETHTRVHVLHEAGHRQVAARSGRCAQLPIRERHAALHDHRVGRALRQEAFEQVAVHSRVVRRPARMAEVWCNETGGRRTGPDPGRCRFRCQCEIERFCITKYF